MNLKNPYLPLILWLTTLLATLALAADPLQLTSFGAGPSSAAFRDFAAITTGDWQRYGQLFTGWQASLFPRLFLLVLVVPPALFLLHFLVIGAKEFDHASGRVLFFGLLVRIIHWLAAASFTVLAATGLMIIFGRHLGGGSLVMGARSVHLVAALVFTVTVIPMFLAWLRDMLPMPWDLAWFLVMGGYLSRKKKPVPAARFNAGQKLWFWLATVGGGVMAWSGYELFAFRAVTDQLRLMAILHNFLGAALVAFFIIHLYMSLFAVRGSLASMLNGYKCREEVEILHSRYRID